MLLQEADFHLYTLYNKNKPKSDDLMMELGKQFFRVCISPSAYSYSCSSFLSTVKLLLPLPFLFKVFSHKWYETDLTINDHANNIYQQVAPIENYVLKKN